MLKHMGHNPSPYGSYRGTSGDLLKDCQWNEVCDAAKKASWDEEIQTVLLQFKMTVPRSCQKRIQFVTEIEGTGSELGRVGAFL